MIVQAGASVGTADISFTVPEAAVKQVQNTLLDKQDVLGYHSFDVNTTLARWPWWRRHEDSLRSGRQVLPGPER